MSQNKSIRIKDIARLAKVSVGTVDRVIHNRGKVSQDARKKIEQVLNETGYKPNLIARTLGSNKPIKIATIIPDPKQDEYWALSQKGIDQSIDEWAHYNLRVIPYFYDLYESSSFTNAVSNVLNTETDGILMAPIFYRQATEFIQEVKARKIPFALFNTNIPETDSLCFIGQDLYQSGRLAGELISLGQRTKKDILVLHVYEDVENSTHLKAKEKGIRDYFEQADPDITTISFSDPETRTLETQLDAALKQKDPGAIFVSTSKGTHIIAAMLEKLSRSDIMLVGYDPLKKNVGFLKMGTIDFLINQSPDKMTRLGISHLTNHLLFQKSFPKNALFPLEIMTRENIDTYTLT